MTLKKDRGLILGIKCQARPRRAAVTQTPASMTVMSSFSQGSLEMWVASEEAPKLMLT